MSIIEATLLSGIFSALGAVLAVIFTNKWNSERYKRDKIYYDKKEKFVIVKLSLKFCSFFNIIDEMIVYNIRDRVLLLSSDEGFEFYDDDSRRYSENHRIVSIKNNSSNSIKSICISVASTIITESQAVIKDSYTNYIQHLRHNEEILFRVHNTMQRKLLWEELSSQKRVVTKFNCKVTYLTEADECICYEYTIKINSIPQEKEIEQKMQIIECARIEVEKDEYYIVEKQDIETKQKASYFRNVQDYIVLDRAFYLHKKIGGAQAQGIMQQSQTVNTGHSNNVVKSTAQS